MRAILTVVYAFLVILMAAPIAAQRNYIGTMNTDGSNKYLVYEHTGSVSFPHWSPDMSTVAFRSDSSTTGRGEIFTYEISTNQLCQLTNYGNYYGQSYSRYFNDTTIWYSYSQQAGFSELAYMIVDECNVLDSGFVTDWYSTGRQSGNFDLSENYIAIYVQNSSNANTGEIYIAPLIDLTDTTNLTSSSNRDDSPDINNAETKIVYLRDNGYNTAFNIYTMDLDGSNKTQITFLSGSPGANTYSTPLWSADDSKIYCSYYNGTQYDIIVMNPDGSDPINITNTSDFNEICSEVRGNKLLFSTDELLPNSNILYISSYASCIPVSGDIEVPVYVDMTGSACGMQIPLTWSSEGDFELVDVSFDGTALETWDYPALTIDNDNHTVVFGGAAGLGDPILPGENQVIAYLEFAPTFGCTPTDTFTLTFDTTTVDPASLVFSDCDDPPATYIPSVDFAAATVYGYVAGDANGDCQVNIGDAVMVIAYVFQGGSTPVPIDAGDANGDCSVNIGDGVYLINYIFKGGPAPACGCASGGGTMIGYKAGQAGLSVAYDGEVTTISSNAFIDMYGVQLEVDCSSREDIINYIERTQLYAGASNTLGILDINGQGYIPAGNSKILEIPGQADILSAIGCDENGNTFALTINQTTRTLPEKFALHTNYPNPFNPTTTIKYSLPEACNVTIVVYNITGQTVKTLVNGFESAGEHSVIWDGRDASGQSVASGIYLYRISAGRFTDTKKMQLLK